VLEPLTAYSPVVWAFGVVGLLLLMQLLVADIAGVRAGHVPGSPVPADHGSFLFRAVRAHANTNETIAAFILLALFGIFRGASAEWLNGLAWLYVGARVAHMACYYADVRIMRSVAFVLAFAALLGMLIAGSLA
jgi:uncharacterized MAPEG superfamily protein